MGSRGRNSVKYRKVRELFKTGAYPCHLCGQRPGTTVDHVPPLSTARSPEEWEGTYKPACLTCQGRQGAGITNRGRARWRY